VRKLVNETWFSQHRESLDLSIGDMMQHLCAVIAEAKQLIAEEAARYIVRFKQYVQFCCSYLPVHSRESGIIQLKIGISSISKLEIKNYFVTKFEVKVKLFSKYNKTLKEYCSFVTELEIKL